VLHHRWPEGEEAIAKDAGPALAYARDVLHRLGLKARKQSSRIGIPWYYGEEVYNTHGRFVSCSNRFLIRARLGVLLLHHFRGVQTLLSEVSVRRTMET